MDFRNHSPRIRKCENHGFSQGFAMDTLLMVDSQQKISLEHDDKDIRGHARQLALSVVSLRDTRGHCKWFH